MQRRSFLVLLLAPLAGGCPTIGGSSENSVIVPRAKAGKFPTTLVVDETLATSSARTFELELSGRDSLWLSGGTEATPFELTEGVVYELRLTEAELSVVAELSTGGQGVWRSGLTKTAGASKDGSAYVVRDSVQRDEVDFFLSTCLVTLAFSTAP